MNKSEAIKYIESTFDRLAARCDSDRHWGQYVELHEQSQREHRKSFCPPHCRPGLTDRQSVKLFAVKKVFDTFIPRESGKCFKPTAEDYFTVAKTCFGAWGIHGLCKSEILKEFTLEEMALWLRSIDYVKLNEDPRYPRHAREEVTAQ